MQKVVSHARTQSWYDVECKLCVYTFLISPLRTGAAQTPHLKASIMGKGNNSQKNDKKNKKVKKDDKKPAGKTPAKK